jgi:hypothetical protein
VIKQLQQISPDHLTPKQALEVLYQLMSLLKDSESD